MDLLTRLGDAVTELARHRPRVLVGIDGPDASGKTTLADRLGKALSVPALRVSVDDFHQPAELRRRRGALSPEGYYRDAFDHDALITDCLLPFRAGSERIRVGRHDLHTDEPRDVTLPAPPVAALVVDGVFLLRPELRDHWDLAVHLRITPEESLRRARLRDVDLFGSVSEVERRYLARYLPGQALYQREADPESRAHVVVDNEHPGSPAVERWEVAERPAPALGDRG
ncbi:nucleoside/nucleotide kinase family protein [Micromonospora inositola]|uniref:Uridine kinase n=1 Tax=Micromonospora inositola TaxID=47865 RepID=A0A1C5H582_9ACTN|nr:uridine kinase [Micromonospora inositola]SCG41206.1 uridine kinase [Micromonospora inositola]